MPDPNQSYKHAHSHFAEVLATVRDGDWAKQTPCAEWTVRDLVGHVVGGEHMAIALLEGATKEESTAVLSGQGVDGDLLADYGDVAAAADAAFATAGALERTVHHPIGDVTGDQLIGFRIGDLTLHSWDLARAITGNEALPDPLVAAVWDNLQPIASFIGTIGLFGDGPSGSVGEDAELQLRLLDLTGRRP